MRKLVTKKTRKTTSPNRRKLVAAAPRKGAACRAKRPTKRATEIVTSETTTPLAASALEDLLVAFAHGNQENVKASINQLCHSSEVKRLNSKASELLESFHASIWSLRSGFDTSNLSMTSTSLPEASKNLDKVLVRAGEAAHKVLALVEQQEAIQSQGEQLLLALERQLANGAIDRRALELGLTECRALAAQTRKIASEMVYTQDFEDLCGQVIYKVRRLILSLEEEIRNLLLHLKVEMPSSESDTRASAQQGITDQASVDDLLKNFGL
jgi:chemotaxis regulatin CheY-phosphate phosphatase CheZ